MTMNLRFGRIREDKKGRMASNVHISLRNEGGWDGHYRISTHGLDQAQIVAAIDAVQEHHRKKAERLTEMASVQDEEFNLDGETFVLTDLSIHEKGEAGAGNVTLFVNVKRLVNRGDGRPLTRRTEQVGGFPLRQTCANVDGLPAVSEIRARVIDALVLQNQKRAAAGRVISGVQATLQLRGGG